MTLELELAVLLGLVAIVLACNAAFLWLIHLQVRKATDRVIRQEAGVRAVFATLKSGLSQLEAGTERVAVWSSHAKERVHGLDRKFDRVDSWVHYGLAKIDFRVNRIVERLDEETARARTAIWEPLTQTATVIQGVRALLKLVCRRRWASDASGSGFGGRTAMKPPFGYGNSSNKRPA